MSVIKENLPAFRPASLPPCRNWPKLAGQGQYLASESRVTAFCARMGNSITEAGPGPPVRRNPPVSDKASAPCEVWTWDMTWMPGPVAGMFFCLYRIVAIFSRKIVG